MRDVYVHFKCDREEDLFFSQNLILLYDYIELGLRKKNYTSIWKYGSTYRYIKQRAIHKLGRQDIKISKRQVSSLINCRGIMLQDRHISVPYNVKYIFEAIFEIVNELQQENNELPKGLEIFLGQIRRNVFYEIPSAKFYEFHDRNRQNKNLNLYSKENKNLNRDLFGEESVLSERFSKYDNKL